jgi:hypothetical protein
MTFFAAEIREQEDVRKAVRQRKEQLQLSNELLESYSGLCAGHLSKILPANPTKRIGWGTLPLLLGGLGLRILVIEDPEATRRILNRSDYVPRQESRIHRGADDASHATNRERSNEQHRI